MHLAQQATNLPPQPSPSQQPEQPPQPPQLTQPTQPTQPMEPMEPTTQLAEPQALTFELSVVGLKHYDLATALALSIDGETDVVLQRDPTNPFDSHAISANVAAMTAGERAATTCVGMLEWRMANDLSPLLDSGAATVLTAHAIGRRGLHELLLTATIAAHNDVASAALMASDALNGRKVIAVGPGSLKIGAKDADDATCAARQVGWPPPGAKPWDPEPRWSEAEARNAAAMAALPMAQSAATTTPDELNAIEPSSCSGSMAFPVGFTLGWTPHTPCAVRSLASSEVSDAQAKGWPPPDGVLLALGLGSADDAGWWASHGLLPPRDWQLTGALDMLPACKQSVSANLGRAAQALDGGAHGCLPWLPDTLEAARAAMHGESFWCRRKGDAFIRAFGGPYVLGQDEGKLKLIRGAEHTPLTRMISVGHSLIYTATHLTLPTAPGFNTLIFGLNLRSSGFYYHQDAEVPGLAAKNAPLVPQQPVVTTVIYDDPQSDSGKEVLLFRPALNWEPRDGPFTAARALYTPHGTAHIQRAGLQRSSKHGVFHAPGTPPRESWRVALTGRVAKPDAAELVEHWVAKGAYSETFGPAGEWQLPTVLEVAEQQAEAALDGMKL